MVYIPLINFLLYVLEDVTLSRVKDRSVLVQLRFKGGATKSIELSAPIDATELFKTKKNVIERIDQLLDSHTEDDVARILNKDGVTTGRGKIFTPNIVRSIRRSYNLKSKLERIKVK